MVTLKRFLNLTLFTSSFLLTPRKLTIIPVTERNNMEIKDILALTQAGFSKDEILKMTQPTQQTQQTQKTQKTQQPNTDALLLAINNLTATIQAGNVQATGQNPANKVRTPDDVIDDLMKIM